MPTLVKAKCGCEGCIYEDADTCPAEITSNKIDTSICEIAEDEAGVFKDE